MPSLILFLCWYVWIGSSFPRKLETTLYTLYRFLLILLTWTFWMHFVQLIQIWQQSRAPARKNFLQETCIKHIFRLHVAWKATFSVHQYLRDMAFISACFLKNCWLLSHPCRSGLSAMLVIYFRSNENEEERSWLNQTAASLVCCSLHYFLKSLFPNICDVRRHV